MWIPMKTDGSCNIYDSPKVSVAFRRLWGQVGVRVFVRRTCGWEVSLVVGVAPNHPSR